STKINGESLPEMEPRPRILQDRAAPGSPPLFPILISRLGEMPAKASPTLGTGRLAISSPETEATEPVKLIFFWVPYPTTTTSSREDISSTRVTSMVLRSPTDMLCVAYPMKE